MVAGKSVIYMGLISGPIKADDTCGRTTVTGTMDRGFTVFLYEVRDFSAPEGGLCSVELTALINVI
jgi:hypothetical protein